MKKNKLILALILISNLALAQIDPNDKIKINGAKTVDGTSPGLVKNGMASDDFLYDDEYINHYGFGFHGYNDNGGSNFSNPVNAYVSGYFGIDLFTGGINRFRINQTGNIGIGTSNPAYTLDVNGAVRFGDSDASGLVISKFTSALAGVPGSISGIRINGPSNAHVVLDINANDGNDGFYIRVPQAIELNATANKLAFVVKANGNVGIGTSSPGVKLDVAGSIKIQSASTEDNNSPGLIALGSDDFLYDGHYINNYGFGFHGYQDGSSSFTNPRNAYVSGYFGIDFFTGATSRMRISRDGLVSIGTPKRQSGYMLAVDGKVVSEEIKVEDVSGADFVFAPDYNLMPLPEIETFVKQYHHLPEVPSAKEMKANGVELGKMNMLLLQKIEEMTLHQIEQNKKIEMLVQKVEAQDKEITKLKNKH